jgi:hypothetical protein
MNRFHYRMSHNKFTISTSALQLWRSCLNISSNSRLTIADDTFPCHSSLLLLTRINERSRNNILTCYLTRLSVLRLYRVDAEWRINMGQLVEWELAQETELIGRNLPQCHFVHKSHMTWTKIESQMNGGCKNKRNFVALFTLLRSRDS